VSLAVVVAIRLELSEVLEISEEREHHLRPNRGDHDLGQNQPHVFDGARATRAPVTDKGGCLVVPFVIEVVDRVLERPGGAVIVLGRHEHERIEGFDLLGPLFRVLMRVLAKGGQYRLIEQWEVEVSDVNELDVGIPALFRQAIDPMCDSAIAPSWPRASGHDCDSKHVVLAYLRLVEIWSSHLLGRFRLKLGAYFLAPIGASREFRSTAPFSKFAFPFVLS